MSSPQNKQCVYLRAWRNLILLLLLISYAWNQRKQTPTFCLLYASNQQPDACWMELRCLRQTQPALHPPIIHFVGCPSMGQAAGQAGGCFLQERTFLALKSSREKQSASYQKYKFALFSLASWARFFWPEERLWLPCCGNSVCSS